MFRFLHAIVFGEFREFRPVGVFRRVGEFRFVGELASFGGLANGEFRRIGERRVGEKTRRSGAILAPYDLRP